MSDGAESSEKEHLIGREFVPTGTLGGTAFNFIFRACEVCNDRKGNLERHVSTITLFTSPARAKSTEVDQLARRKASKDYHPQKKGSLVQDSHLSFEIPFSSGGVTGKIGMSGPPRLDEEAAMELAFRHLQGFFSLITSVDPTTTEGTRLLQSQQFYAERPYSYRDWGNVRLLEIVRRAQSWTKLGFVTAAKGFFRAEFRRDESETGQWFWALEWNKSTRVIGLLSKSDEPLRLLDDLPEVAWKQISPNERMRVESPLANDQVDQLFRGE